MKFSQLSPPPPRSPRAPRSVYLSDGGVLENTGILALLQRRQRRILAVYTGEESVGQDAGGYGVPGMAMCWAVGDVF